MDMNNVEARQHLVHEREMLVHELLNAMYDNSYLPFDQMDRVMHILVRLFMNVNDYYQIRLQTEVETIISSDDEFQ